MLVSIMKCNPFRWGFMSIFVKLFVLLAFVSVSVRVNGASAAAEKSRPNVAIIGAGAGGTGVAYFLTELFNKKINIDIYEKNKIIGGRMASKEIMGNEYEVGGSILHPKNKYAVDLVAKLGLRQKTDIGGFGFSVMNGEEVVFSASKWSLITLYRMLYRYGFEMFHLGSLTAGFIEEFIRIYDLQDKGATFKNPEDLLLAMSPTLLNLTRTDFRTYLTDLGYSTRFIEELVQAITYVNYGQDTSIHSFVGSVAIAGADGGLWSVQQGNKHLANALYNNSIAKLKLKTPVSSIIDFQNGTFGVSTESDADEAIVTTAYDYVVIASALEANQIKFKNFKTPPYNSGQRKYHRTIATMVVGHLKDKYYHLVDIMTCSPQLSYTTLSRVFPTKLDMSEKFPVYKIFSHAPITQEQLDDMFIEVKLVDVNDWLAYPNYDKTPPSIPAFILDKNIFYVNAIEWAASAIEMSLISAKNIALLIAQQHNAAIPNEGKNPTLKTEL